MRMLIILVFLLSLNLHSENYVFDSRGNSEQKILNFKNNKKYIHISTVGWWTDSLGNYGIEKCYGKTEILNDNVNLDIVCELIDQNKEVQKVSRKRNSLVGAGIGINTYLETSEKYNFLLGKECTYAVTFLNKDFFYKQKCKQ